MAVDLKSMAEREMEAYDALPRTLKVVFDECPRKVSVLQVMRLPNVRAALNSAGEEGLAAILKEHFEKQAQAESHVPT
jgi:hypothetical protein